jgi:16S rRNA C967 or C1407 C5-methylase (RsmB/RsmF family)/NOL1/NOP2/fmu family ribosome biogenesis protein
MNFPTAFEHRVKLDPFLGEDLLVALNSESPVSVRINPPKMKGTEMRNVLEQVSWCNHAFYLKERPSYTLDPLFHAGCYYPQEAGSMVLDQVLRSIDLPQSPVILDLCAAPGGKSTLITSFLDGKGLLISNEVIQARSRILRENMTKWGKSNVVVTNNDPKDFQRLSHFFDAVVIDAPCSGEGMFRKDPDSRNEWTEDNVQLCAARQKRIVADVWDTLKPGGYLIYSTCTFNRDENEDNIEFIRRELEAELYEFEQELPILRGRERIGYYCIPAKTESEGFYIAVLKKPEGVQTKTKLSVKKEIRPLSGKEIQTLADFVATDGHRFFQWNENVLAFPEEQSDLMQHVIANMRIVKAGTVVGEISRKGLIPHEELALSADLCIYDTRIEVDREQALHYLHGDTYTLKGQQGFNLITYKAIPLGWIKHLGNRFNNLYPKDWRIRMSITSKNT